MSTLEHATHQLLVCNFTTFAAEEKKMAGRRVRAPSESNEHKSSPCYRKEGECDSYTNGTDQCITLAGRERERVR